MRPYGTRLIVRILFPAINRWTILSSSLRDDPIPVSSTIERHLAPPTPRLERVPFPLQFIP